MMLVMLAVFGVVVMLLWNALMPQLFGFPVLNYWQAAGILLLVRVLFGGLGHGLIRHGGRRDGALFSSQANKLREKWMNMSEEERKEFIEKEREFMGLHGHNPRFRRFFDGDDDEDRKEEKKDKNNE